MAKHKEMAVHEWLKREMKKKYGEYQIYIKAPAGIYSSRKGISDFIYCVYGFFIAIEVKVEGNVPSMLQQKFLDDVTKAGGLGICLIGKDFSIFEKIDKFLEEHTHA